MTFIKICGITNLDDALAAVDAGADALGFNFYKPSPRYVAPETANEIIRQLPPSILTVGVFVNEDTPEVVKEIARQAGVAAIQLHGDESPDYCRQLAGYFVIKVLSAGPEFDPQQAADYNVDAILLDTKDDTLRGGTGRVFDWSIAREAREAWETSHAVPKLFLAGGLGVQNVAEAIISVDPYGIDACSKLEETPGKKNHERMRAFVKTVRSVKT